MTLVPCVVCVCVQVCHSIGCMYCVYLLCAHNCAGVRMCCVPSHKSHKSIHAYMLFTHN